MTELVLSLMRVSDTRIASLRGRVLQGRSTGRTEVQVLSPITGETKTFVLYFMLLSFKMKDSSNLNIFYRSCDRSARSQSSER